MGEQVPDAGQPSQPGGQGGQIPAPGGAVYHLSHQPLQVGDLPQGQGELLPGDGVLHQVGHPLLPPGDAGRGEEGPLQPAPEQPAAHGGFGLVQHPQQGALFLLAPHGGGELQRLPGGEIQLHKLPCGVVGEGRNVAQIGLLGLVEVSQQSPGGLDGGLVLGGDVLEAGLKLPLRQGPGRPHTEPGLAAVFAQAAQPLFQEGNQPLRVPSPGGQHRLGGVEAGQLVFQMSQSLLTGGEGRRVHLPGGDVTQAQAKGGRVSIDGADVVVPAVLQHGRGNYRARGDHPDNIPVHQSPGLGGILGLLADSHLVALGDKPGDVAVAGVVGYAAHGGALLRGLVPVPGGQGQVQLPGHQLGVLIEHLIKVPQPEKQNGIRILGLDVQILLHHGGKLRHGAPSLFPWAALSAAHLH